MYMKSSRLKRQESQEGDKTHPLGFKTLYRFGIRDELLALLSAGESRLRRIRPGVTPAGRLYSQTGREKEREISLWESDSSSAAKNHRGEREGERETEESIMDY